MWASGKEEVLFRRRVLGFFIWGKATFHSAVLFFFFRISVSQSIFFSVNRSIFFFLEHDIHVVICRIVKEFQKGPYHESLEDFEYFKMFSQPFSPVARHSGVLALKIDGLKPKP
jgi:hypothetical protein